MAWYYFRGICVIQGKKQDQKIESQLRTLRFYSKDILSTWAHVETATGHETSNDQPARATYFEQSHKYG